MTTGQVVIGVGHPYRRDDGVGPAVIDLLDRDGPKSLRLVESSGEPVELIDAWDGVDQVVLVDAVHDPHGEPGRIHRLDLHGPALTGDPAHPAATSSHGVPLEATLALARALDRVPAHIVLYAVEVTDVGFGAGLSPAVAAAARTVADEIRRSTPLPPSPAVPVLPGGPAPDPAPGPAPDPAPGPAPDPAPGPPGRT